MLVLEIESRELQYESHVLGICAIGIGDTIYILQMLMLPMIHEAGTIISLLIERLNNLPKVICLVSYRGPDESSGSSDRIMLS